MVLLEIYEFHLLMIHVLGAEFKLFEQFPGCTRVAEPVFDADRPVAPCASEPSLCGNVSCDIERYHKAM
jgi:hypothetical protein